MSRTSESGRVDGGGEARTLIDAAAERLTQATYEAVPGYQHLAAVTKHPQSAVSFEDLERFAEAPRRIETSASFETPAGFVNYVNRFREAGTRIFASLADRKVLALLDYHVAPEGPVSPLPSWVKHRAVYPAEFAPAFGAWHGVHGVPMSQRTFAEFLEDRASDAVEPDPATLMEVAQVFDAIRNVDFRSAINVSTNERQFRYEEKDAAGGAVTCPKLIQLFTPVFQGCDLVAWVARLAYDISGGSLSFTVKIHRLQELLDGQFERLCDAIAVDCPDVPLHRGKPGLR